MNEILNKTLRPFYLEALSGLAAAYIAILLDESKGCRLLPRVDQQRQELEAAWENSVRVGVPGIAPEQMARARKEDTLEDLMYWTGQLSEAYPEFADKVCVACFDHVNTCLLFVAAFGCCVC